MTVPRVVLGRRPGPEFGVFVSPEGIDATTAPASALLLHITSAVPQIYMLGVAVSPFPRVVPHGLTYAPLVFPNLISTKLMSGTFSYVRPYDNTFGPWVRSRVKPDTTQFTIDEELLPDVGPVYPTPLDVNYFVYNRRMP